MTGSARIVVAFVLLVAFAPIQRASADPIYGRWRVQSSTAATLTLDGKETLKGPFVDKPTDTWIRASAGRYVLDDGGTTTTYALRRSGREYILSRKSEGAVVTVRLSNVKVSGKSLRFTSTRINRPRQERYVVHWLCVRASKADAG